MNKNRTSTIASTLGNYRRFGPGVFRILQDVLTLEIYYLKKSSVRKGVVLLVHSWLQVFGVVYAALALLAGVPGCVLPTTKRTHIHHSFNVKE